MRYRFIKNHAQIWPVTIQCDVLDVQRSAYYRWLKSPICQRVLENKRLKIRIKEIFIESIKTYGSKRIQAKLREENKVFSRRRISKMMRILGLFAKQRRKFIVTTDSKHNLPVAENLLNRQFNPKNINKSWTCDITYIPTSEGWLYLAAVLDLGSKVIAGWSMSENIDAALVCSSLRSAVKKRRPPKGLLLHSDRGSQYASRHYRNLLESYGFVQSMSRKGNCWDNAPMESFFHSLKVEWLHGQRFKTRDEAKAKIFEYIEIWYNRKRLHSSLGYQTPCSYELKLAA
jgi:putative transposase